MRQLQLFTTAELATMRDRTRSRRYSPAKEQFRREHERHRAWGLKRRHAGRLRHVRDRACAAGSTGPEEMPQLQPSPSQACAPRSVEGAPGPVSMSSHDSSSCGNRRPVPTESADADRQPAPVGQGTAGACRPRPAPVERIAAGGARRPSVRLASAKRGRRLTATVVAGPRCVPRSRQRGRCPFGKFGAMASRTSSTIEQCSPQRCGRSPPIP